MSDRVTFFLLGLFVGTGILVFLVNESIREWNKHKRKRRKDTMFFRCIKPFKGIAEGEVWELGNYFKGHTMVTMSRSTGAVMSSLWITLDELYEHFEFCKPEA